MRRAIEILWKQFLAYCGRRAPCERLALEFVRWQARHIPPRTRGERASSMLAVIQTQLILSRSGRVPR